jgi:hypothetical protein
MFRCIFLSILLIYDVKSFQKAVMEDAALKIDYAVNVEETFEEFKVKIDKIF